jgi:hypothetical protein
VDIEHEGLDDFGVDDPHVSNNRVESVWSPGSRCQSVPASGCLAPKASCIARCRRPFSAFK